MSAPSATPVMRQASDCTYTVENQDNTLQLISQLTAAASSPTRAWQAMAVWLVLTKTLNTWHTNIAITTPADIAATARFKDPLAVLAALDLLERCDAVRILPAKPHHRKTSYQLSPHLVWRGALSGRPDAIERWNDGIATRLSAQWKDAGRLARTEDAK